VGPMKRTPNKSPKEKLIPALLGLRQKIRDKEKRKTGRTPIVCTDESIRVIAELRPRKPSDFYCIPGVGPAFVEKYAHQFLKVLEKYDPVTHENREPIPPKVEQTLRELSKKLININKRNRMLYLPRLAAKYAVDLYDDTGLYNPLDLLFNTRTKTEIASSASRRLAVKERHRHLCTLLREATRDLREKGQNDLYVAYPFAEGMLPNGDFGLRAPLCLFPVTVERNGNAVILALDHTRDVMYNGTLILAHDKFNAVSKPLPDCTLDESNPDTFLSDLLKFYADNGVNIVYDSNELKKFKEYTADSFARNAGNSLKLVHHIVVGKFPAYSNAIQRDFEELVNKKLINRPVVNLLSDYGSIDFYSENQNDALELNSPGKRMQISEHSLTYIHALNNSQEAVLRAAELMDELVVEGPPGTGKSQTITSLITQFVKQGKNVLMVSEKKTALDVVYSRLGNLSRYSIMVDDATNKDLFYTQLERLLQHEPDVSPMQALDLSRLSNEIDTDFATLELIASKLFTPCQFGVSPYILYMENKPPNFTDHEAAGTYRTIRTMIGEDLMRLSYQELSDIHKKFENGQLTDSLDLYHITTERFPWFLKMQDDLSGYDLILLSEAIDSLLLPIDNWKALPFLQRLSEKGRLKKEILQRTKSYFRHASGGYITRLFLEQSDAVKQSLREYTEGYANLKPVVASLTKNETAYLSALRKIHKVCGKNVLDWNQDLYNTILFEHIQRFEAENRTLLPKVASFDKIVHSIERAIGEKQKLSGDVLERVLSHNLRYINASKRKGEICRTMESKRRPGVAKFIQKFDFEIFKSVKIWLMSPDAVSELLPQENGLFDLLIFDEASQLYIEKAIPSIVRAKKVVIAGDHKQLRPSSLGDGRFSLDDSMLDEDAEIAAALEEESLLDLARFRYPDVLLNTHYRSKYEELIDFSNYAFYKGKLLVAPNTDTPKKPPIEVHLMKNAVWQDRTNRKEAEEVVALIKQIFATRQGNETIGVITFNIAQRDTVYDVIEEEMLKDAKFASQIRAEMARKDNGEDTGLFVKNIESVQGDERDIIIFSIGYAKNESGKLMHNFGWLNQKGGENRLNVAISRAKKKIHIVTSFMPHELSTDDMKNDGPRILKRYLEYAFAVSNNDKKEAERILQSFGDANGNAPLAVETEHAKKVASALREKGYDVEEQVGIGGYRIDIAIRKNGKYVLGLECDGKLYNRPSSARERDYHRQKYLESRGWRIMRIWSMDWWRNSNREIQKISTIVDSL